MNLEAELAANMKVFSDFTKTRAAVNYPAKMDVPLVWDLYMDTARPVGQTQETASITAANGQSTPAAPLEAVRQADYTDEAAFTAALSGVDKLLLISSSEVGQRATQHQNVINAAKTAGV